MRAPWVIVGLLLLATAPLPALGLATEASCSTGGPQVTNTSGAGDPQLPSLVYMSLKTGFRAAVMWETEQPEVGRLRYSLDGGGQVTRSDPTPRTLHLFVIDGLPIGRAFCFTPLHQDNTPATAASHAFLTRNAMNAHDGTAYTVNLLVLANQVPDVPAIQYGLDGFAQRVWDSSDGGVRIGRIALIVQDPLDDNSGWKSCYLASVNNGPICKHIYDVIFTYDYPDVGVPPAIPLLTTIYAATYRDGIQRTRDAVWMNAQAQGGLVQTSNGDIAGVIMHEMGHYIYGAQDLYGPGGAGPNCWDPATEISIMGNNFGANEFDDELHRCPPGSLVGPGPYVPSFTGLRQRFPLVPDRTTIAPGPTGDGGLYARHTLAVIPYVEEVAVPPLPQVEQDDAGSGGDAGAFPSSAVPIQPGILYEGTMLSPVDGADMYRMDAPAGSTIEIAMYPRTATCFTIVREDGSTVPGSCSYADGVSSRRTVSADGAPLYVKFLLGTSPSYRFGYGVDEPAPSLV